MGNEEEGGSYHTGRDISVCFLDRRWRPAADAPSGGAEADGKDVTRMRCKNRRESYNVKATEHILREMKALYIRRTTKDEIPSSGGGVQIKVISLEEER
ncbi:hypothetical protein P5V15_014805 [Pogonomyrmex californicus]